MCDQIIGTMQGRLLNKYKGNYQAHPVGYWQNEFALARKLGLSCIEFIFDYDQWNSNPLMTIEGRESIRNISQKTGVNVTTVCADYFMIAPLHHGDQNAADHSSKVFLKLLDAANDIGATDIVLPCVDNSSLKHEGMSAKLLRHLDNLLPKAESLNVNICLETDLDPDEFYNFLERFQSENLTVNYDTGNSASLGYDIVEEFEAYGSRISDLHIKDRLFKGGSVLLGTGDVDFEKVFCQISRYEYDGPIIMQAYRDDEGFRIFHCQLNWLKQKFNETSWQ